MSAKISRQGNVRKDLPQSGVVHNSPQNETLSRGAKQSPGQSAKNTAREHVVSGAPPGPFGSGYTSGTGRKDK